MTVPADHSTDGHSIAEQLGERDANAEIHRAIESGATIVTATRRLSREMVIRYDQHQLAQNKSAWQSADILPWDTWVERCWGNYKTRTRNAPLVLSDQQLLSSWQKIIASDIKQNESDSEPLWHTRSSATAGIQALKLVREWQIDPQAIAQSSHRDHRCFSRWLNQFDQLCTAHNWIDRFQIAHLLRDATFDESSLLLAGFDRLLPQQATLLAALETQGIAVSHMAESTMDCASVNCLQFKSETDQWLGAAGWARQILEQNPSAKLAIVAANPGKSRELIDYCLRQILCPEQIRSPDHNAALPFHISLGQPLSSYPPVREALSLLNAVCRVKLPPEALCNLVRSSYLRGAKSERLTRAHLELWIRQTLPQSSDYRTILRQLNEQAEQHEEDPYPLFRQILNNAHDYLNATKNSDLFANWSAIFEELLALLGWPGEQAPDTREFQAIEAFYKQLRRLGELDLQNSKATLSEALSALQHLLDQQIFQIEGNDAPVQVLGVLETSGMSFDHIWFGSLTGNDWPNGTRPNPFIPIGLQRQAGVEQASVEENYAYASVQQSRITRSCQTLNLGFHQMDGDVALEPSPLISGYHDSLDFDPAVPQTVSAIINAAKPKPEHFFDNTGTHVTDPAAVRGGTSLVQMQANCPRGAYAAYRLGARRLEDNEPGLDAAERGSLVHHALELAWNMLQTSTKLHQMQNEALQALLNSCVVSASNRYRMSSGCGDRYFERLHGWLLATLQEWFALEKQRSASFRVLGIEEKTQLTLSELPLDFKIDRIDQLASGELVLIDYKTGSQNTVSAWAEERISAPQLPLYTLSQQHLGHTVYAVVFAQVRLGECAYIGVAEEDGFGLPAASEIKVRSVDNTRSLKDVFATWEQCTTHWRYSLENLAEEFMFGDARVAPGNEGVCENCPTPAICRSGDRVSEEAE